MPKPPTILILILIIASFFCVLNCYALLPKYLNLIPEGANNPSPANLPKRTDAYGLNLSGTEIIARVDSRFKPTDPNYEKSWLDGQIVDIRPLGFHTGKREKKRFAIIKLPQIDYWTLRGSKDWKSTQKSVLNLKKYLTVADNQGNYPWEVADFKPKERRRDFFVDFRHLLDHGYITKAQYFDIYDKTKVPQEICLNLNHLTQLVKQENKDTRLARLKKNPILTFLDKLKDKLNPPAEALVSEGTYSICASGCDYTTLVTFEADIDSQLTGNLTAEHANEETSFSSVTFDTDTNGYLLKITAAPGAEHNGGAYGNGARINYGTWNGWWVNETNNGDLDDFEISRLAFDTSGTGNWGFEIHDGGNSGRIYFNRLLIVADSTTNRGIKVDEEAKNVLITNCILYGVGSITGIHLRPTDAELYNNTVIGVNIGIYKMWFGSGYSVVLKNNLCQNNNTDYDLDSTRLTTANNISEDDTSPDAAYRNKVVAFADEANDDYRLSGKDTVAKDQAEDLSGIFSDDVQGQSRSSGAAGSAWDIGADEALVSGVTIGW